jgi:hypothetical protein
VQSTNRQFVDLQFADPRPFDNYSADGQAADGERANCDRADGRGPKRECQKTGGRSYAGLSSDFAPHGQPPEQNRYLACRLFNLTLNGEALAIA